MSALSDARTEAAQDGLRTSESDGWRRVAAAYFAGAWLLALVVEPAVLKRISAHDYHNFDLGIYSQALYLIRLQDPNPWLTVRETKIFNDHFDPILLIVAPWAKWFEPTVVAAVAELLFVLSCPLAIVWLYRRRQLSTSVAALAIFMLLGNRAITGALQFPAHPTTWAILPMSLVAASILLDKRWCVFASCTLLFLFKEEFPFVGIMVGLLYLVRRDYRFGLAMAAWSLAWIVGVFYIRPLLMGPVHSHASGRFVSAGDLEGLRLAFAELVSRPVLHTALPLVPLALWALVKRQRTAYPLALLLLPLLGTRFLGRAWGAHYLAPLVPLVVLAICPIGPQIRLPRWVSISTIVLLVAVSFGPWKRSVELMLSPTTTGPRPATRERLAAIEEGRQFLLEHGGGEALVQGNLIPALVRRPALYQVAGAHDPAKHTFRYVLIEKPPSGDPWPIEIEDYRRLLAHWQAQPGTRVIIDNPYIWLAEGSFRDQPRR